MASEWVVIAQHELVHEKITGGFIRAYCHLHGGDKQRSLAINENNGFGRCHNCGAQVVVRELNSEAAANIERGQGRIAAGEIRVRDPKYIARAAQAPRQPRPRSIETWQQEEIALLRSLKDSMAARLGDDRARAYIEGRGLALATAAATRIGYIPDVPLTGKYARIARWADHIVIPVYSPSEGLQFAGRWLKLWQPGMDENEHKALLDSKGLKDKRYLKTHAGGLFNYQALDGAGHVTIVEGAFDALACIEAGLPNTIAIIGTALTVDWLPKSLGSLTLAFDGDKMGREKAEKARDAVYIKGHDVEMCTPPDDDMGKDWSERYRLHGAAGLAKLMKYDDPHCKVCGAEVEHYSPEGVPFCATHWAAQPVTA